MNTTWIRYLPAFARLRLEGRGELQKIIGNTGWLFADKILRMGVGLVVGVWLRGILDRNNLVVDDVPMLLEELLMVQM